MTSPFNPTVEAAYSHASVLGDKSAALDEVVEEVDLAARELQGAENAIEDLTEAAHAELGDDLWHELEAVAASAGHLAERLRRLRPKLLDKAGKLEREYHDALAQARELEAVGSAGVGE